jgi:hypothetical protein
MNRRRCWMTRITLRHRNMGDCQGVKIAGSIPARSILI